MKTENLSPWWKVRFCVFFLGQSLSLVGSALTQFVIMWWVTQQTGSAQSVAMAGIAGLLPMALIAPFAGVIIDRINRKAVLIIPDIINAVCIAVLFWLFHTNTVEMVHIYALLAIRSCMQAFQQPAVKATTPLLVPDAFLSRASGLNQAMDGVMVMGAAPLGALILSFFPLKEALCLDIVTALFGVISILLIKIPAIPKNSIQKIQVHSGIKQFMTELKDGIKFVYSNRGLFHSIGLNVLNIFMMMPVISLTPIFVTQYMGGGLKDIALMEFLAGVGMIIGGILATMAGDRLKKMRLILMFLSLSCFSVFLCVVPSKGILWVSAVIWFGSSVLYALANAPYIAIVQKVTPPEFHGRVFALYSSVIALAAPLGLACLGILTEYIGIRYTFMICGITSTLIFLSGFLSKAVLNLEHTQSINK